MFHLHGYKLQTTKSTLSILCSARSFSSLSEFVDRIPACTLGCKVLTLPFRISGDFVIAEISLCSKAFQPVMWKIVEKRIFGSLYLEACLAND